MAIIIFSFTFCLSLLTFAQYQTVDLSKFSPLKEGEVKNLSDGTIYIKNASQVNQFKDMGKINPKYFRNNQKVTVEICNKHFPDTSIAKRQITQALNEYAQSKGTIISWTLKAVPHRNADDIISSNIKDGSLRIDFADVEKYPNECKRNGPSGSWILTRCGYSNLRGWKGGNLFGNLNAGAILINRFKYCENDVKDCLIHFPKKHAYLHELGHFFGMTHSNQWSEEDQIFSSVMGAYQNYLTAYDMKNLRRNYSDDKDTTINEEDLAVIGKFKGDKASKIKSGRINEVNPQIISFDNDRTIIKDAKTKENAFFQFGLFNRSSKRIGTLKNPIILRITLLIGNEEVELKTLSLANIAPYSEFIWRYESQALKKSKDLILPAKGQVRFKIENSGFKNNIERHQTLIKIKVL